LNVQPAELLARALTLATDRIFALPIVVLMPHSRCNCRCVMCDIWRANDAKRELTPEDLAPHLKTLRRLRVRSVVLSGGEALMHQNLWTLCEQLRGLQATITLLSTGLLLARHAGEVTRWCDEVIVSLDGSRFRVTARCVLQRANFRDLPGVVAAAHDLGLDGVSFLAADVSTTAFNRPQPWGKERAAEVALSRAEAAEFATVVEEAVARLGADFASGFIAEEPAKLRRLPRYYAALAGDGDLPPVKCNAPWVSTVVEADGTVRPCFFHRALGNLHERPLGSILNSKEAIVFRRSLDVRTNPICRRCVCTLHVGPRRSV
jgi:Fe-coproporphyrin III synthase